MADDRDDCDGVDARCTPRFPCSGFPDARLACLVLPGDFFKFNPFCLVGGEVFNFHHLGGLWHVVGGVEVWACVEGARNVERR